MSAKPPIVRISKWDMYRLFNEGRYHQRMLNGEFIARLEDERPATIVSRTIPANSISTEVFYYDQNGNFIARVHYFVSPTGEIVASRKHDPKRLVINGILYRWRKQTDRTRTRLSNRQINNLLGKTGLDALMTYPRGWWDRVKNFWYNVILGRDDW